MSTARSGQPGTTRACPHCRETILESATVCPACRHHLRYDETAATTAPAQVPLRVEGSIRHPAESEAAEYTVLVTVRNDRGEEIARKLVAVGALLAGEQRGFTLSVEVTPARGRGGTRGGTRH
ncbi:MAG: hypothetical protein LKM32_06285 [Chiayiivirga sp.]|uniref:hypothetical protein n=1 Tax=Chiayiivirga sp. TaxID=2041042 RepID=UPI0025C40F11|nr:hypothetical protein [Chiayiivirga sp.]MCI1710209.1 hypothetical protein [Chiayiivirga sp.]MCI1728991.1 hypothetical protein [Chiayiivirga sp.]